MKKMMIAFLLMLAPLSSQALIEARAGYGVNNLDTDTYNTAKIDNGTGLNVDLLFKPPMLTNFGFGLRYEMMKYNATIAGIDVGEGKWNRLSALVNYRIIDTFFYVGPIGTIGINSDFTQTDTVGVKTKYDDKLNWSAGFEGGVHLGLISVGAELGKVFGKFTYSGLPDLKVDGLYGKIIVGFGF